MNPKLKKNLILFVKIAIVLLVFVWVGFELYKSWNKIQNIVWKPDYLWLSFSALLYLTAYVPAWLFWHYSLRSLRQEPGLYESFRAYYIGHLGKYVPGKAVVVILRSGLLRHDRTRASVAAAAVFFETLTMMAAGAFLSALIIVVWFRDIPHGNWLTLLAIGMMCASGLPVFPPIFRRLAKKLGVGRTDPDIDEKLQGVHLKTVAVGWGLTTLSWLLLGLSLWATIKGIGLDTGPLLENLPRWTLAASFSVVLGFVAMIPAGVGVRDSAMAIILTSFFVAQGGTQDLATVQSLLIAGVQRLISILAELAISAPMMLRIRKTDRGSDRCENRETDCAATDSPRE